MKKFTWESFRTERIAVRCRTEAEAAMFLEACRKAGFTWGGFAKIVPDKYTHHGVHGEYTCYIARKDLPWMQYRPLSWVLDHEFWVRSADEALRELAEAEASGRADKLRPEDIREGGLAKCCEPPCAARWRDAEEDKPTKDGEYIVCYTKVEDCEFCRCVERIGYDLTNSWDYIEGAVITHWLDGVPPAPEVVVR